MDTKNDGLEKVSSTSNGAKKIWRFRVLSFKFAGMLRSPNLIQIMSKASTLCGL